MATAVGEEDAAAWVNAVLAEAAADGGTVDSRIASVSLKLQTMSADLHADVDADMRALLAAAPRAVGEIEDLQAALQRVQDELAAVDARVARAVRNATEAATLEELDRLREHLEAVGATLVEAASWQAASRAAADALGAFLADRGAADWAPAAGGVAEKLEKMERAEKVLRTLPEADARRARRRPACARTSSARSRRGSRPCSAPARPTSCRASTPSTSGSASATPSGAPTRKRAPFAARNVWFAGDGGGALAPRLAAFLDALLAEAIAERARVRAVGRRGPGGGGRGARRARGVRAARAVARRGAARRGGGEPGRLRGVRRRLRALRRGPGAGPGPRRGRRRSCSTRATRSSTPSPSSRRRRRRRRARRRRRSTARSRAPRLRARGRGRGRVPRRRRGHGQRRGRLPGDGRGGAAARRGPAASGMPRCGAARR